MKNQRLKASYSAARMLKFPKTLFGGDSKIEPAAQFLPEHVVSSELAGGPDLLLISEHLNATYYLSFLFPVEQWARRAGIKMSVFSQKELATRARAFGQGFLEGLISTVKPDLVVLSRCSTAESLHLVECAASAGIPTLYHIDDDLLAITDHLGDSIQKTHGRPDVVEIRRKAMRAVDLVYASTNRLRSRLQEHLPGLEVISGRIYAPFMRHLIEPSIIQQGPAVTIGYMGSKGHQADLELVVPALDQLLKSNVNMRFETFGTIKMPEQLLGYSKQIAAHSVKKDYLGFLAHLSSLGWSVGLAPLQDTVFNRCRAPTKFVEYTACGIYTIASDVMVYEEVVKPGSGRLAGPDQWKVVLEQTLNDAAEIKEGRLSAEQYCRENFSLQALSLQIEDIFGALL
ncbi:MAG: hypothetical protein ABJ308_10005 [Halieaceae bacterium]